MSFYHVKNQFKIEGKRVFLADKCVLEIAEQDNFFEYGNMLVVQREGKYDLYILSSSEYELYNLYKNADEYIYENGILFIKADSKYWIVISTSDFAFNLSQENFEDRKSALPKLVIKNQGEIEIINKEQECVLINFENKGYNIYAGNGYVGNDEIRIRQVNGVYEKLPIAYHAKLKEDDNTESFVNFLGSKKIGTNTFCNFHKIEEFKEEDYPMVVGYYGYWGKDENGNICGIYIDAEKGYRGCEVCLNFEKPVEKVKFCVRKLLNEKRTAAIDVWKIVKDGEESFIFQTIGADANSVKFEIPKECLDC